METGEAPLLSILMAVYEPRLDWLKEQLDSVNAQTYPNLRLYVRDDCSPTVPFETIRALVGEHITKMPYSVERNEKNLGSNKTFERLTEDAEGEYFAYCDQDDIWLPEKLSRLHTRLVQTQSEMAYCAMSVIDATGAVVAEDLRQLRPRLRYVEGVGLSEIWFFRNCSAGCAMLLRSETARAALPFPAQTVCDQWLAIVAAGTGRVTCVREPMQQYRQHGKNQTGVLMGVTDQESYRRLRLEPLEERLEYYERHFGKNERLAAFVTARLKGETAQIWRGRALCRMDAAFEIAMRFMPERLFQTVVRILK